MLITLLTDFGTIDYFVAAMKGRILSADRGINIVDISHDVPPHDVEAAAFLIRSCADDFPPGTVHVVVVDPGVGSSRLPIVAKANGRLFVAPDNGVLTLVLQADPDAAVRAIRRADPNAGISSTFHGRDIFAPTAARLAAGEPFEKVGPLVDDPVKLARAAGASSFDGLVRGRIIHIDHFGNCVTDVRGEDLPDGGFILEVGGVAIDEVREFYQSSPEPGPFLIRGSAGFLEISMLRGSAAEALGIRRGDKLSVRAG